MRTEGLLDVADAAVLRIELHGLEPLRDPIAPTMKYVDILGVVEHLAHRRRASADLDGIAGQDDLLENDAIGIHARDVADRHRDEGLRAWSEAREKYLWEIGAGLEHQHGTRLVADGGVRGGVHEGANGEVPGELGLRGAHNGVVKDGASHHLSEAEVDGEEVLRLDGIAVPKESDGDKRTVPGVRSLQVHVNHRELLLVGKDAAQKNGAGQLVCVHPLLLDILQQNGDVGARSDQTVLVALLRHLLGGLYAIQTAANHVPGAM